jgi:hypothetical protein
MSGSYQNLYMLYNSLQGQINNIDAGAGTLQETLNLGNQANSVDGNVSEIVLTDILPDFGVYPNTTILNSTTISVAQQVDDTIDSTTLNKLGLAVSDDTIGSTELSKSRIVKDNISTNYYYTPTNYAGVNLSSSGSVDGAVSIADGSISLSHMESVAGTKTKDIFMNMYYEPTTVSWNIDTPDTIAETSVNLHLNQNVVISEGLNVTSVILQTLQVDGQATFENPPHSVTPILGNDLATKGYVDTLVGNYGGNGLALYFNVPPSINPITSYPVSGALEQNLSAVDATPPADYYTVQSTALGTDTKIATFITPVGYPNTLTIPSGLWNMLIYGFASGAGGNLYYHFHLSELKTDASVVLIATSGFSSDVNALSSTDPDSYHASLSLVEPYSLDSLDSRLILDVYSTGTGMGGSVELNTLFGGLYYSFVSTSLSGGTSILTTNNNWTGTNTWEGADNEFLTPVYALTPATGTADNTVATCELVDNKLLDYANKTTENTFDLLQTFTTGIKTQYIEAPTPDGAVGLYQGQIAGGNITLGSSLVETTVAGTLKATTPITNTNDTTVPTTAWVNTWFALASSLSSYLTTAAAASTYQTLADMSNYLTTATASATYATIASLSAYGAKATTNTWALLQSYTVGVQTQSIVANTTTTDVSLFTTNTAGTIGINSTTGTVRCGGIKLGVNTINNQLGNNAIYIGNEQTSAQIFIGQGGAGTRTGAIWLGKDSCPINIVGNLTLDPNRFITLGSSSTYNANTGTNVLGTIGYTYSIGTPNGSGFVNNSALTTSVIQYYGTQAVPVGVYMVTTSMGVGINSASNITSLQGAISLNGSLYWNSRQLPNLGNSGTVAFNVSGVVIVSAASSTIDCYIQAVFTGTAPTMTQSAFDFKMTRIA